MTRKTLRRDVLISTDPGCDVDDQFVLAHLLLTPQVRVHGIMTSHAPNLGANPNPVITRTTDGAAIPAAEITKSVAQAVLAFLPAGRRPPLIAGASKALRSATEPLDNDAVRFIIEQSRKFSRRKRLVVLAIGAATDIASALLLDPSLAERIHIVALAFDKWPEGGDPFNVPNDVHAWQVLFDSAAPLTIADLAVTIKHLSVDAALAAKIAACSPLGGHLADAVTRWINALPDLCRSTTGGAAWPIWDQAVTAYLLGMTRSVTHPRPRLLADTKFDHGSDTGLAVEWITAVDQFSLWADLRRKLSKGT